MDRIIRAIAADNFIKMSVIDAKDTVQRAVDIHHPSVTASAALGRALCAASLLRTGGYHHCGLRLRGKCTGIHE